MSKPPFFDINMTFSRNLLNLEELQNPSLPSWGNSVESDNVEVEKKPPDRPTSIKYLQSCYQLVGNVEPIIMLKPSTTRGAPAGGRVTMAIYHDVRAMTRQYVERNGNGDVILVVVPSQVSAVGFGLDSDFVKDFVDGVVEEKSRKLPGDNNSAGNTVDFGYSSSGINGTGHYLHRFDRTHREVGGSVKNVLLKPVHKWHSSVAIFATSFESYYQKNVMEDYDWQTVNAFPSVIHIWHAADSVARHSGIFEGIVPPFNGCMSFSSASVGSGNSSLNHNDRKNSTVCMGTVCDAHASLTDTSHIVFIVHTPNDDGSWTAHAIPQEYMTVTYFRGNECQHMACDANTWFQEIGRHLLKCPKERSHVQSCVLDNEDTYEEVPTMRVWLSTYCKASMYDLAWEFRCYTEALEKPEVYTIVRKSENGDGINNHRDKRKSKPQSLLCRIAKKFGSRSPYSMSYS